MISDSLIIITFFSTQAVTYNNFICILFLVGNYILHFILDLDRHVKEVKEML